MFMKYLMYTVLIAAALLVTFFGLGPVLLADGSLTERVITLLVVVLCYGLLACAFIYWAKRNRERKR